MHACACAASAKGWRGRLALWPMASVPGNCLFAYAPSPQILECTAAAGSLGPHGELPSTGLDEAVLSRCCAVLCCAVLCCAVLCAAVLCCAVCAAPFPFGCGRHKVATMAQLWVNSMQASELARFVLALIQSLARPSARHSDCASAFCPGLLHQVPGAPKHCGNVPLGREHRAGGPAWRPVRVCAWAGAPGPPSACCFVLGWQLSRLASQRRAQAG